VFEISELILLGVLTTALITCIIAFTDALRTKRAMFGLLFFIYIWSSVTGILVVIFRALSLVK
jgi:hypothetical protein